MDGVRFAFDDSLTVCGKSHLTAHSFFIQVTTSHVLEIISYFLVYSLGLRYGGLISDKTSDCGWYVKFSSLGAYPGTHTSNYVQWPSLLPLKCVIYHEYLLGNHVHLVHKAALYYTVRVRIDTSSRSEVAF